MAEDSNLYENEEAPPEQEQAAPPEKEEAGGEEQHEDGSTFLVPKEACPDMQVGQTMTCKVTKVMDDQYQLSVMGEGEAEKGEMEEAPAPPSELASMME